MHQRHKSVFRMLLHDRSNCERSLSLSLSLKLEHTLMTRHLGGPVRAKKTTHTQISFVSAQPPSAPSFNVDVDTWSAQALRKKRRFLQGPCAAFDQH